MCPIDGKALFSPYQHEKCIAVAVSGGSDSLALLYLIHEWHNKLPKSAPTLIALSVDHGLRKEAQDEIAYVAKQCKTLNIPHHCLKWHHENNQKPESAIAEKAREARYALLAQKAQELDADYVLLAHTQNDQAETVLMRAIHQAKTTEPKTTSSHGHLGTGFRGLSAMSSHVQHESGIVFARPLLPLKRETLRNCLQEKSISWIDDPSNENLDYERPRIRKFLNVSQSSLTIERLSRFADVMSRWRFDAANRAGQLIKAYVNPAHHQNTLKKGVVQLNPDFFNQAPPSIQLLALRALIAALGGNPYLPPIEPCQRLLLALQQQQFKGASLGGVNFSPLKVKSSLQSIELFREFRNLLSSTLYDTKPISWDNRFLFQLKTSLSSSYEIRALADEGIQQLKTQENKGLGGQKRRQLLSHPSIWQKDQLVYVPFGIEQDMRNPSAQELHKNLRVKPLIPAFQRFKNPLDENLRQTLQDLMTQCYFLDGR